MTGGKYLTDVSSKKNEILVLAALAVAVLFSIYSHSMIWSQFYYPTYGNTNIHVAFAKYILVHGGYPLQNDFSYGGGIPALYVPGYRLLLAGTAFATGGNMDLAERLLVMLFSILLPVGFFLFGREIAGDFAGLAAAFFTTLPAELLIYTVRPLPQALGLALLPFALYAVAADRRKLAFVLTFLIAMIHQETVAFFAVGVFAFGILQTIALSLKKRKVAMPSGSAWTALLCWAIALTAYVGWHVIVMGNANIFGIAQFSNHEGNVVEFKLFVDKTGYVVAAGSLIGLVLLAARNIFKPVEKELLLIAFALVGFAFIKNELVGIRVFMDRFIVFLQIPLIALAAVAFKEIADYLLHFNLKSLLPRKSS